MGGGRNKQGGCCKVISSSLSFHHFGFAIRKDTKGKQKIHWQQQHERSEAVPLEKSCHRRNRSPGLRISVTGGARTFASVSSWTLAGVVSTCAANVVCISDLPFVPFCFCFSPFTSIIATADSPFARLRGISPLSCRSTSSSSDSTTTSPSFLSAILVSLSTTARIGPQKRKWKKSTCTDKSQTGGWSWMR